MFVTPPRLRSVPNSIYQITHSEWSSETAYSASAGSGVSGNQNEGATAFKRLPFNFCAVSLQPFKIPVSTAAGTIFDLEHIQHWLKKHDTNPINGEKLSEKDLIPLHFRKNEAGDYADPVTYKVFTDNSHIVVLKNTGNVFAWETVERLNIKAKMWRDLVSDKEFTRSDIITVQDPQNVEGRNLNSFQYLKDGIDTSTAEERRQRAAGVNKKALGEVKNVTKPKEADRGSKAENSKKSASKSNSVVPVGKSNGIFKESMHTSRAIPYNAAQHTTGKAAASFTSTGLTPETSGERALLTDEEYMLKPKRVKVKGYARISTNLGDLNVELHTEHSPRAVWNFVQLSKKGFYKGLVFHRNIRNFMVSQYPLLRAPD
jgi:peptidyl-prolyl cis-trans isomerase-like protein 2